MIRISTIVCLAEDTVIGAGRLVARKAKGAARAVNIEYSARQISAFERKFAGMDAKAKAKFQRDHEAIMARAAELRA